MRAENNYIHLEGEGRERGKEKGEVGDGVKGRDEERG